MPSDRCSRKQFTPIFWDEKKSHHNIYGRQLLSFLVNKTEVSSSHISTLVFILLLAGKTHPWINLHFLDLTIPKEQQKSSTIAGFHGSNTKTNSDLNRKQSPADITKSCFAKHEKVDLAPIHTLLTVHLSTSITVVDLVMSKALWFSTITEQTKSHTHRKPHRRSTQEKLHLFPPQTLLPLLHRNRSSFYKASIILWKLIQNRLTARFLFSLVKHWTMLPEQDCDLLIHFTEFRGDRQGRNPD